MTSFTSPSCTQVLAKFFSTKGFVGPITDSFDSRLEEILSLLDRYPNAPFTVQRLAEVLIRGTEEYRSTHGIMNGLVRILSVDAMISDYEESCLLPT
jgi:hypothetical protein